jgi:hypothetical protein
MIDLKTRHKGRAIVSVKWGSRQAVDPSFVVVVVLSVIGVEQVPQTSKEKNPYTAHEARQN